MCVGVHVTSTSHPRKGNPWLRMVRAACFGRWRRPLALQAASVTFASPAVTANLVYGSAGSACKVRPLAC